MHEVEQPFVWMNLTPRRLLVMHGHGAPTLPVNIIYGLPFHALHIHMLLFHATVVSRFSALVAFPSILFSPPVQMHRARHPILPFDSFALRSLLLPDRTRGLCSVPH
jgi:hypothetical protein